MKHFVSIGFLISNLAYASSLPYLSYECTSTAKFYEKNILVMVDNQTANAGYVNNSSVGMIPFLHTYKNYKIHTAILTGLGSYDGSKEEHSEAWYLRFPNSNLGAPISSSRFEAIDTELPEKFALTVESATLAVDLMATLRVVCKKQ